MPPTPTPKCHSPLKPCEGLKRLLLMWNDVLRIDFERRTSPVFLDVVHQWRRRQISGAVLSCGIGCLTARFGLGCSSMDCATHSHAGIWLYPPTPKSFLFPNVIQILGLPLLFFIPSPFHLYMQQLLASRKQLLFLLYCSVAVTSSCPLGLRDNTVY